MKILKFAPISTFDAKAPWKVENRKSKDTIVKYFRWMKEF